MNVVIVAAGNGARLLPLTRYLPKCLSINANGCPLLVNLIMKARPYKTYLIVREKDQRFIRPYCLDSVLVRTVSEVRGTCHAIREAAPELVGKRTLLLWSDYVIDTPLCEFGNLVEVFTSGNENRFDLQQGKVVRQKGNVCGGYYFPSLPFFPEGTEDVADYLVDFQVHVIPHPVQIRDYGDHTKFIRKKFFEPECRFFNELVIHRNYVTKHPRTAYGKEIIRKEIQWYQDIAYYRPNALLHLPKVYVNDETFFEMERIRGIALFRKLRQSDQFEKKCLIRQHAKILKMIWGGEVYCESLERSVFEEVWTKPRKRYQKIASILKSFGDVTHVHGDRVFSFNKCLSGIVSRITYYLQLTKLKAHWIHGDCQFGNAIYSLDGRIKLIDPRGYFGHLDLIGIREYDLAKQLFAISGYDEFNADPCFHITKLENGDIEFPIRPLLSYSCKSPLIEALMITIWLGLGQYFEDQPAKCLAAISHGRWLATRYLTRVRECPF